MSAIAQATLDEFAQLHGRMRAAIKDLDDATLDRAPADGENSIAVLIAHTLGSELGWLHRAAGRPFKRDRDAEFRTRASTLSLAVAIDDTERQVRELVTASEAAGLDTKRVMDNGRELSVAYCVTQRWPTRRSTSATRS